MLVEWGLHFGHLWRVAWMRESGVKGLEIPNDLKKTETIDDISFIMQEMYKIKSNVDHSN